MIDTLIELLGIVCESGVLFLLLRRRIVRLLPLFTIYIGWTLLSDTISVYMQHAVGDFQHFYLFEMSIDALLQFPVLVELAWSTLRPVRSSLPRATPVVLTLLVALAGTLIWPLAGKTVPPGLSSESILVLHLLSTFAILRVVCFLLMASFSQLLSIGWRDRELQVATGLGFYAIVSLIVSVLHSHQLSVGPMYHNLDIAVSVSYLGTLSYWAFSFATKEQERKEFSPQMHQLLLVMGGGARASRVALTGLPPERLGKKD